MGGREREVSGGRKGHPDRRKDGDGGERETQTYRD